MRVCQFRHIRTFWMEFYSFKQRGPKSNYIHSHASGRAFHRPHRRFQFEAVQVRHLHFGDLFYLFLVILPTLVLCGSADPFAKFTARLISTGTGGVFVTNVNDRSE